MSVTSTTEDAPLMLSVSGARGIVGRTMTPATAAELAAAFGSFLRATTGEANPLVCVGRDSRPSGEMLTAAAVGGLIATGCRVVQLGVVATPTVGVAIGEHRAAGGLVVTASHNPIQWNGLKCLDASGVAPPPDDAAEIIRRFRERDLDYAAVEDLQPTSTDDRANDSHLSRVLAQVNVEAIRAKRFRVVLDSVNGAGCAAGRMLLDGLGCEVVHLNGEPTGRFAHVPEPTEQNLTQLANATGAEDAACGFAQDPDADRLAIVDESGRYIGEEYTLALCAKHVLAQRGPGVLAANLSTSRMIDDLAAAVPGAQVLRTAVGEANVVAAMKPADAILGGEGNGGVILPDVCWVRDSLSAIALVLDLLAADGRALSVIVDDLPRYVMIKRTFDLTAIGGHEALRPMLARVQERFADARLNTADGVRIDFDDGWVHLRPSNTEPIVRLIAEATTDSRVWELVDEVAVAARLR